MKTSELTGAALDWAVARCEEGEALAEGWHPHFAPYGGELRLRATPYAPSTDWSQGGPIIERERINLEPFSNINGEQWSADGEWDSPTPLIAAMRCYVASKLGDDINIPKELL
jgi:hypothetical protein